jgi:hypothetical protein
VIQKIKNFFKKLSNKQSSALPAHLENENLKSENPKDLDIYFQELIKNKDADGVEDGLPLLFELKNDKYIHLLHQLIMEQWHYRHEDIIHDIQSRKNPASIKFIKQAIQTKFTYLEAYETGTRQFINQCGHALASIGTDEAIELIIELSKSNDPILKDEMLYRISRIENRNDYNRNYEED